MDARTAGTGKGETLRRAMGMSAAFLPSLGALVMRHSGSSLSDWVFQYWLVVPEIKIKGKINQQSPKTNK